MKEFPYEVLKEFLEEFLEEFPEEFSDEFSEEVLWAFPKVFLNNLPKELL